MDLIYSENCLTGVILASSEKKKKVGCTYVESLRGKEGRPGPFEWNDKSCGIYAMTTWCELWIFAFSVTASSQKTVKNIYDDDDGDGKSPTPIDHFFYFLRAWSSTYLLTYSLYYSEFEEMNRNPYYSSF